MDYRERWKKIVLKVGFNYSFSELRQEGEIQYGTEVVKYFFKLSTSLSRDGFLSKGVTMELLKAEGNAPEERERLIIFVIVGTRRAVD